MHQMIVSSCRKPLYLSAQNINCTPNFFLEIFQRFCKLVILDTLGINGHTHQNWQCHLAGMFQVYMHVKNQLHTSLVSWDIAAKLFQACYFG